MGFSIKEINEIIEMVRPEFNRISKMKQNVQNKNFADKMVKYVKEHSTPTEWQDDITIRDFVNIHNQVYKRFRLPMKAHYKTKQFKDSVVLELSQKVLADSVFGGYSSPIFHDDVPVNVNLIYFIINILINTRATLNRFNWSNNALTRTTYYD